MTEAQVSLNNFVRCAAECRRGAFPVSGEETPPILSSTSLSDIAYSRGLESLYIPFENINNSHKYKGKLGFCYSEAFALAERDPSFIYCEGYAVTRQLAIPLAHAWCVHRETGEVYDPVWNNKQAMGIAYCGVPFVFDFVVDVVLAAKQYGVLDSINMLEGVHNKTIGEIIHPNYLHIVVN